MQANKILSAKLIDIIFDGRNKAYGAYELRNTYSRRIKKALFITFAVAAVAFGGTTLAHSFKKSEKKYKIVSVIELTELKEKPPEKLPEPDRKPEPPQEKTQKFTDPVIVDKEEITEPPPSQEDLVDSRIDLQTNEGTPDDGIPKGPQGIDDHKGIVEDKINKESDEPRLIVDVQAKFKGNWENFLRKNLNPQVAVDNEAPAGSYTIIIQFVVDKEGNLSEIKPITSLGYGMEQEAIRVLKKAAKWDPAIQDGYPVKAYRRQPITFQVLDD